MKHKERMMFDSIWEIIILNLLFLKKLCHATDEYAYERARRKKIEHIITTFIDDVKSWRGDK